jgi:hypothetical protein
MSFIDRMLHPSMSIRFQLLFVALLLTLSVPVLLPDEPMKAVLPVLFTVLSLAGLATAAEKRSTLIVGLSLAVPAIALHWLAAGSARVELLGDLVGEAFLLWVTFTLLMHNIRAKEVTSETLFGVACVYLLFALIWAMAYGIVLFYEPNALALPESLAVLGNDPGGRGVLTYFSFVTLTTLGYGDVAPASDAARMLAVLEATLGQLFLVIVVARLVGMHTAQHIAAGRAAESAG